VTFDDEVTVRYVRYANEQTGWAVLDAAGQDGTPVALVGPLVHLEQGERARIVGDWVNDSRYGPQVKVSEARPLPPQDPATLTSYLQRIKHVGARRAARRAATSPLTKYTASQRASSSHGSVASSPDGRSFRPSTVIVRSPSPSTYVNARRCPSGGALAWTVTPRAVSCSRARQPSWSLPSDVKNSTDPLRFASWTAATAPPPAASSHVSSAWTMSPGSGTCSTRTNSTHST